MNHTLSHNTVKELEESYYKHYSEERYISNNENHIVTVTSFSKEYIVAKNRKEYDQSWKENVFLNSIINHSLRIRRFDLLSNYNDHNNSPSARSFHSTRLVFIINGYAYYYAMYTDQFLLISSKKMSTEVFDEKKTYLIGVSDILNLSRLYNEFSLYISMLDSGHLLYNIKNELGNYRLNYYQYTKFNSQEFYSHVNLDKRYSYVSFALEIEMDLSEVINVDNSLLGYDKRLDISLDELCAAPHLRPLIDCYNNEKEIQKVEKFSEGFYSIPFINVEKRNSAHTIVGNYNKGDLFEKVKPDKILSLIKTNKKFFNNKDIQLMILKKESEGTIAWFENGNHYKVDINYSYLMYDNRNIFDMNSYNTVVIGYSTKDMISNFGLRNHITSFGEVMQFIGIYINRFQYSFRPMKNHNDSYIKDKLNLQTECTINYMGVVCNAPTQQVSYYM
ncbi:hypothetical protein [Lentibacillus sp. CBA3610]|uniref:hypothetical protein n=1 Tax=Lentibacillus sp. CBA3610 TaxID=2518176 RepID=UPI0015950522|nr:hypothetical protein [Lentibacillus sp. CBA3610]QKY71291.1 hypothetical protein Len3610_18590 [Lentibacillus sp. CBA3610]